MSNRPQSTPLTRFTRAAHEVIRNAREDRMIYPGLDPMVDELENALDDLCLSAPSPDQIALRETVLWRFHRPEVAAALRFAGDAMIDLMNEAGEWGPEEDVPTTVGEVRAASDDLDHLARYLEVVAGDRRNGTLDEASDALSIRASGWAERLDALVLDIRRSVAKVWNEDLDQSLGPEPGDEHGCN